MDGLILTRHQATNIDVLTALRAAAAIDMVDEKPSTANRSARLRIQHTTDRSDNPDVISAATKIAR